MVNVRVAFLVLISLSLSDSQFIMSTYYADSSCFNPTSYTVFGDRKCQTVSVLGVSSSTLNVCGKNDVTSTVYLGDCSSNTVTQRAKNPLGGCIVNGGNISSTVINCPTTFPYTNTSYADGITVTFAGSSCQGTVYSILVTPGAIPSERYCNETKCTPTNINTSKRFICGNSPELKGYADKLRSDASIIRAGIVFSAVFSVFLLW